MASLIGSLPDDIFVQTATVKVPHPVFILTYGQKNITNDITPYVLSVTYTDYLTGKSDELEVVLEDTDGRWIDAWYPGKSDTLSLALGYDGEALLPCGKFVIDEIEFERPPSIVTIKALSAGVDRSLRTRKSAPFENTTLASIAMRIAKRNKLTLTGKIRHIPIARITQFQEEDIRFLARLGTEYGYVFKVVGDRLVFTERDDLHDGQAVASLRDSDLKTVRLADKIKGVYSTAKGKYQDASNRKLVSYEMKADGQVAQQGKRSTGSETSADTLKFSGRASSRSTMQVKAQAALNRANRNKTSGTMTVVGNPRLVAGNTVELLNMGKLSGKYLVESARHSIDRSGGYTTEIEVNGGLATTAKTKNRGTLKVYGQNGKSETVVVGHSMKKGT